jgi:hypothetical protein
MHFTHLVSFTEDGQYFSVERTRKSGYLGQRLRTLPPLDEHQFLWTRARRQICGKIEALEVAIDSLVVARTTFTKGTLHFKGVGCVYRLLV